MIAVGPALIKVIVFMAILTITPITFNLMEITMPLDVTALLVEIETIHSEADIEQEVTDQVKQTITDAVAAAVPTEVAKDTAPLQAQLDSYGTALKSIVDKLTAVTDHTETTSSVLATAQNALAAS